MHSWKTPFMALLVSFILLVGCGEAAESNDIDTGDTPLHGSVLRTIDCKATATEFRVTIAGDILGGAWSGLLSEPVALQYGSNKPYPSVWALPYTNGDRQSIAWRGNYVSYTFVLAPDVDEMNFALTGARADRAWFKLGFANNWIVKGDCEMVETLIHRRKYVPQPAQAALTVVTNVVNNDGGSAQPNNFMFTVKTLGMAGPSTSAVGSAAPGTVLSVDPGTFVVQAVMYPVPSFSSTYRTSYGGHCSASGAVTLVAGEAKTCVITFDDNAPSPPVVPGTLVLSTGVTNDNGGTMVASRVVTHVRLAGSEVIGSPLYGLAAPGIAFTLLPNPHVVSVDPSPGYVATIGGACAADGSVTVVSGTTKTCTITLDDVAVSPPPSGDPAMTIRCKATSSALEVVITGPVQNGIFAKIALPDAIQYGGNAPVNYWTLPYPTSDTTRARTVWTTDAGPYVLVLPPDAGGLNFYVTSKLVDQGQWFNLNANSPWTVTGDCMRSGTLIVRK